ncbi:copper chaperone NosL [Flagellimonas taeanensis]|jgi:copper chaperone NosL|uniref:Copper chaperone NosL n=1 Tax=Flagellimonas taeanensis TaxID=1005926 RepID=A0A1M6UJW5_9FLAO|nr:nitrous oxide reductase accessory protein NosL [Allomuricauda taeanensis]SFC55479.1 copper chaperone NosL [Allomuricauda taeanensis]SHK69459.1 copper chaperone NosL [Allomuricauda taeanensis]
MKQFTILLFAVLCVTTGCSVGPKPIDYGNVGCHYCSMTIVDKQHAAQLVTEKGKPYNFDAIECMMNHLKDENEATIALFLVNDFDQPGALVDATKATYLISENIPSPMGEYLSAFTDEAVAKETRTKQGGELFTWMEINNRFKL